MADKSAVLRPQPVLRLPLGNSVRLLDWKAIPPVRRVLLDGWGGWVAALDGDDSMIRHKPDKLFNDGLEAPGEKPRKRITDAQIVELVWAHSQCVHNRTGKCPLLIFGKQLADALDEFFWGEE